MESNEERLETANQAGRLQSISLPVVLASILGIAMLLARGRYQKIISAVSPTLDTLLLAGGCLLLVYAVGQVIARLFFGSRRSTGLSRDVVLLPREGMIFLVIMLTLAAGALIGRSNLLMLVFSLMAGPFVLNGLIVSFMLKRIKVSRRIPERAMAGQPLSIPVEIENKKRLLSSRLIAVHDRIRNKNEELDPGVLFVCVPPRESRRSTYTVRLQQRGVYEFGPMYVASRFPLGLGERGRVARLPGTILIHPRIGRLRQRWLQQFERGSEFVEQQRGRKGIFDDEFHRIREYRSGDNPRAIHWRTSARLNELMVREFEQNRDQNLCVMLDLGLDESASDGAALELELAISFVATVCCEHIRRTTDSRIGLFVAGKQVASIDGLSSKTTLELIFDTLAEVEPTKSLQTAELVAASASIRDQHAKTVLVTRNVHSANTTIRELASSTDRRGLSTQSLSNIQIVSADRENLLKLFVLPELTAGSKQASAVGSAMNAGRTPTITNADAAKGAAAWT